VAVKILVDRLADDPRFMAVFRHEVRQACVSHPNIVRIYDSGSAGARPYVVMELVPGPSLAQVLHAEGGLDVARALTIAGDVAAALQAAHEAGLVHGDLSPGKILLPDGDPAKVTDFGIAYWLEEEWSEKAGQGRSGAEGGQAASGDLVGDVAYLSPEQLSGGADRAAFRHLRARLSALRHAHRRATVRRRVARRGRLPAVPG
jgi:serine/threonine protein kinase